MINILFISHLASLTGAERCLLDLLTGIDRTKFRPYVVVPHFEAGEGPLVDELNALDIPTIKRHLVPWVAFSEKNKLKPWRVAFDTLNGVKQRIWAIAHLIRQHDIQVVYTNSVTPIEGALAARSTGLPHIWHLHEAIVGNPSLTPAFPPWLCSRIVAELSTQILVPSSFLIRTAYPSRLLKAKATVVHNGVDTDRFGPSPSARKYLESQFLIPSHHKVVGIVGSLIPVKGHGDFLRAAAVSRARYESTTFLVIGDGPSLYKQAMLSLVRSLELDGCVRFIGYRNDVDKILPGLDLLMLTSKSEAFSRTIIEAMASAVPVVATDCGGPGELVVHGETGLLVPIGSITALASAMDEILLKPSLGNKMGEAGRKRAVEKFHQKKYVRQIEAVIQNVFDEHI